MQGRRITAEMLLGDVHRRPVPERIHGGHLHPHLLNEGRKHLWVGVHCYAAVVLHCTAKVGWTKAGWVTSLGD